VSGRSLDGRMAGAAIVLAARPEAVEALMRGLPVKRELLNAERLQIIGEPASGPDFVLTEEAALRLEVGSDNGTEPTHSWRPVSLRAVGSKPPERPTIGGIVYAGLRHVLMGEPETLKTWAAQVLAAEEARAGRCVLFIDAENGPGLMLERFSALGLSDDEIDQILYVQPVEPLTSDTILADIAALLRTLKPTLVVLDSFDALLELHALDPNSTTEVGRFYRTVVDPLRSTGAAVVLLDHVSKDKLTRGRWAIGSQRKIGVAEVALGFELVHPFARGLTGLAKVTTRKDRHGHLPRPRAAELELRSDANTGAVTWAWKPSTADESDGFRPTRLMEKVSRYVEAHVAEEKVPRAAVEEHVSGKRAYVREAMDRLVAEGYLEETQGPRGARLLTSVHPFREADDDAV
jgi:AAA domain